MLILQKKTPGLSIDLATFDNAPQVSILNHMFILLIKIK